MIDLDRLAAWMDANELPGRGAPIDIRELSGGAQNVIYEIRRGELGGALRIPPPEAPAERDAGILREWRIIEALDGSAVPHVEAIASCSDTSVLGRAFYLMGLVDGWSPMSLGPERQWPEPFRSDLALRRGLGLQLIEGIAAMAEFDWRGRGLGDLGRPDGFHERQVARWTGFFERIKGRELEGMDVASGWLGAHQPIDFVPGLMHGDYQFANVMFREGAPARLAAILDWEMGTIGDPKLDLAWVVHGWPEDTSSPDAAKASYVDLTGMPNRGELIERFAQATGRQVDDMDYYLVLAKWKLAIVLERGFQRAGTNPKLQAFGAMTPRLMREAADLAESSTYGR